MFEVIKVMMTMVMLVVVLLAIVVAVVRKAVSAQALILTTQLRHQEEIT